MSRRKRPRITTILAAMVVGIVAIILLCCILLFLNRYRDAMVQSARTSSAQAVSQVSNTVGSYMRDMYQAMELVEQSVSETGESRDWLLAAFLKFRPDVVAVTSYSEDGRLLDCWSPDREPRQEIYRNLSFDLDTAQASGGSYITAPHVETIFEGWYPWVVTMTSRLEAGGESAWVSLDLSFSGLSSYISNVSIGQRGYCFLMDADGNIVYHPQQQLLYAGLKSEDTAALAALEDGAWADDTVIYSLNSVGDSGWRVVGVSYVDELVNRNVNEMIRLSFWLAAVVLCVALLTSLLLSKLLGRPLRGLAAAMESFESDADHFTYRPVGGTREVQELSASFEHMVLRIQQLMSTVREEEINLPMFVKRNKMFLVLCLGVLGLYYTNSVLNTYMAQIAESVGGDNGDIGRIFSVLALMEIPTMMLFDRINKRFRTRTLMKFSAVAFVFWILICFLAENVMTLILAQFIQPFSFALFLPSIVRFIDDIMSKGEAVKGQTMFTTTTTMAAVFASLIGGVILDAAGPKMLTLTAACVTALGAAVVIFSADRVKGHKQERTHR